MSSVAIDPATPTTVYAGAFLTGGGVFKSTDAGGTWQATGIESIPVLALAIDPSAPATLYAGIDGGEGVRRSTDAGATWAPARNGLPSFAVGSLAVDPGSTSTVYAGTFGGGVFKSTDGGGTWSPSSVGLTNQNVPSLAVNPSAPSTLYAGTNGGGIFRSTDAGATWVPSSQGIPDISQRIAAVVLDPAAPSTLYAASRANGPYSGRVFRTTNGGGSWEDVTVGMPAPDLLSLAVDPSAPSNVYAGNVTTGVYRSTDSGATWAAVNGGLPPCCPIPPVWGLAVTPSGSMVYAAVGQVSQRSFASSVCTPGPTTLCIDGSQPGDRRFKVEVDWATSQGGGQAGKGTAVSTAPIGFSRGGIFWFFNETNPEMLVKVLNGCTVNQSFWVFSAAGTNVGLDVVVTDTAAGLSRSYYSNDGQPARPFQDVSAFACTPPEGRGSPEAPPRVVTVPLGASEPVSPGGEEAPRLTATACVPDSTTLCLDGPQAGDRRFRIVVEWSTIQGGGQGGRGNAVPAAPIGFSAGGIFWFFDPANPEMLAKLINGCSVNGQLWFFASAGTNVGLHVQVTDVETGAMKTYVSKDLTPAQPIQDVQAFPCS